MERGEAAWRKMAGSSLKEGCRPGRLKKKGNPPRPWSHSPSPFGGPFVSQPTSNGQWRLRPSPRLPHRTARRCRQISPRELFEFTADSPRTHTFFTFIQQKLSKKSGETSLFSLEGRDSPVTFCLLGRGKGQGEGEPRGMVSRGRESAEAEAEGVRRPRPQGRGAIGPEGTGPEKALLPRPPRGPSFALATCHFTLASKSIP